MCPLYLVKKFLCFQDKIDIDFQSEYLRDDEDDDDVFNSEEDENENALFQQLNRDIDIFNRDNGVGTLGNSGKYLNTKKSASLNKCTSGNYFTFTNTSWRYHWYFNRPNPE